MKFLLHYSNLPAFVPDDHNRLGMGGTENFSIYVSQTLAKAGHEVQFYNRAEIEPTDIDGVRWANVDHFNPQEPADFLISFRMREIFQENLAARHKILILADTESVGLGYDVKTDKIDTVVSVSRWQADKIATEEGLEDHECWLYGSNGVNMTEFDSETNPFVRKKGKCVHLSTPERGLDLLLDIWPEIEKSERLKERDVQPELHLFSSFMGWGMPFQENEAMAEGAYTKIQQLIHQGHAVTNHKHVNRSDMRRHQLEADVMLYPTNFHETYCISLTECMAAGAIPVVSDKAALQRINNGLDGFTVGDPESDAWSEGDKAKFIDKAVTALWISDNSKEKMREAAVKKASEHDYSKIIPEWVTEWEGRL